MFSFIGRDKRIENKVAMLANGLDELHGRKKINTALNLLEQIATSHNKKDLEQRLDNLIKN